MGDRKFRQEIFRGYKDSSVLSEKESNFLIVHKKQQNI